MSKYDTYTFGSVVAVAEMLAGDFSGTGDFPPTNIKEQYEWLKIRTSTGWLKTYNGGMEEYDLSVLMLAKEAIKLYEIKNRIQTEDSQEVVKDITSVNRLHATHARIITEKSNSTDFYLRIAYKAVRVFAFGQHNEIRTELTEDGIDDMIKQEYKVIKGELICEKDKIYSCTVSW